MRLWLGWCDIRFLLLIVSVILHCTRCRSRGGRCVLLEVEPHDEHHHQGSDDSSEQQGEDEGDHHSNSYCK